MPTSAGKSGQPTNSEVKFQQSTFSKLEYAAKKKVTRWECFLVELEAVTSWQDLLAVIEPVYPKGRRGRPPIRLMN